MKKRNVILLLMIAVFTYGCAGEDKVEPAPKPSIDTNLKSATIPGNSGNNTLYGTSGGDTMYGYAGNDRLYGGGGADVLYGGRGNDRLQGDAGNDRIEGQNGDDTIFYTADVDGNDTVHGGPGFDTIHIVGNTDQTRVLVVSNWKAIYVNDRQVIRYTGVERFLVNGQPATVATVIN